MMGLTQTKMSEEIEKYILEQGYIMTKDAFEYLNVNHRIFESQYLYWANNMPTSVFFNDKKKATTLMFGDEATVVKCGKDDEYSRRGGFLEAYFQATCGMSKTQAKKYLDKIVKDKEKVK